MVPSTWVKPLNWSGVAVMSTALVTSPGFAQTPDHQWNVWPRLFGETDPPFSSRQGTGRGDTLCLLTPVESEGAQVWSDRPVFAWLGRAEQLSVVIDEENAWNEAIAPSSESHEPIHWLRYGAEEPLEPGQAYDWKIKWAGLSESPEIYFEILDDTERQQIDQDLTTLTQELSAESLETVALARAEYFAQRNLWSDFWSELLSLENPSPDVIGVMQETAQYLCTPPEED